RAIHNSLSGGAIAVPPQLFDKIYASGKLIEMSKGETLFASGKYKFPESISNETIAAADSSLRRLLLSKRSAYVDSVRKTHNDSIFKLFRDSISIAYRNEFIKNYVDSVQRHYADSIELLNHKIVADWNNAEIQKQNQNIKQYITLLTSHLGNDPIDVWIKNTRNEMTKVRLANDSLNFTRMWLKNEQNDSLSVRVQPLNNRSLKLLIDDGVTFTRFSQKQTKDIVLPTLMQNKKLEKFGKNIDVYSPWRLGGDGTVGFTQNYLSNWASGGKSATSILVVLKGYANCSTSKYSWENNIEVRSGWMRIGDADVKLQKNDDKLGITSRFGIAAFKKWFYSTETNFESQFFYGYNYPDTDHPVSSFMAPGKLFFKIGMDYKPSGNFSVLISPITARSIFVCNDKIDPTKFGLKAGQNSLWDPGLNFDAYWRKDIANRISFETKFKTFVNYHAPFSKYDIDWDNVLVMQVTDNINTRIQGHLVYDDNAKFPSQRIVNGQPVTIYRPKWQFQELLTIGFSYKFSQRLYKSEKELKKMMK
ncbi:MAG: DUF3078 domain-containing protein, partial [Bacteroidota bacterium]|nr:DUF3078 domain-containing protein [Bacteroidota bacterium]